MREWEARQQDITCANAARHRMAQQTPQYTTQHNTTWHYTTQHNTRNGKRVAEKGGKGVSSEGGRCTAEQRPRPCERHNGPTPDDSARAGGSPAQPPFSLSDVRTGLHASAAHPPHSSAGARLSTPPTATQSVTSGDSPLLDLPALLPPLLSLSFHRPPACLHSPNRPPTSSTPCRPVLCQHAPCSHGNSTRHTVHPHTPCSAAQRSAAQRSAVR